MLNGLTHQLPVCKAGPLTLTVDGSILEFQTKLKNLGVIFDAYLTLIPMFRTLLKYLFFFF